MKDGFPERRRWWSTPALSVSALVHGCALSAAAVEPSAWRWALGGVAANHAVLTAAGLWPRSRLLGPNWTKLPMGSAARNEVAITIDDGPDPDVTPLVLAQLERHRARATFFCVGTRIEAQADLAREIVSRGHAIENHSQRHRHDFSLLGPSAMRAEIAAAQHSIAAVTGALPIFFRAPAGLRNPFLDPILNQMRLCLASWTRRGFDTVNRDADAVYRRLTGALSRGDILLLHDGNAAIGRGGTPVILDVLPRLLDTLSARKLVPVTLRASLD